MNRLDFKNMSNTDLLTLKKKKADEFTKVKMDIVKLYDYWRSIISSYDEINQELNKRNIN